MGGRDGRAESSVAGGGHRGDGADDSCGARMVTLKPEGGGTASDLEEQIGQWRDYLQRHRAISSVDVNELEDHLREQVADLARMGLSDDEAFLVAVKRMGSLDEVSREFAREHSERLWRQLVLEPGVEGAPK